MTFITSSDGPLAVQLSPYIYQHRDTLTQIDADGVTAQSLFPGQSLPDIKLTPEASDALAQALRAWTETDAGLSLKADMPNLSVPDLLNKFKAMSESALFGPLSQLNDKPIFEWPSIDGVKEAFQSGIGSVTITGDLILDLGVGVGIGVGYAFNPTDTNENAIYLYGLAMVGVEEEVALNFQVGICAASPADISGFSIGATLGIAAGEGVAGTASVGFVPSVVQPHVREIDFSNWTVSVADITGEGVGASLAVTGSLVVVSDYLPPIAQADGDCMFRIKDANCLQKQDTVTGKDEVYITFRIDDAGDTYRWPTWSHYSVHESNGTDSDPKNSAANNVPFYRTVKVNKTLKVDLWQGQGNHIGTCNCTVTNDGSGTQYFAPGDWNTFFLYFKDGFNEVNYHLTIERLY
jgi:hypothetical protein